jgi:CrcB protein
LRTILINALLVGSGGFVGAVLRYGMSGMVHRLIPLTIFPYGTVAVNVVGCLLVGAVAGLVESRQLFGPEARVFTLVGLLGGFTTFSTFGYETLLLVRGGDYLPATTNVGIHLVVGLASVWLGFALASSR